MQNQTVQHHLKRNEIIITFLFFIVATAIYTFPLITAPHLANRLDSPDGLLNSWILSWNLHQITQDPLNLFDANIFFPEENTLAYSENLITAALLAAPIATITDNPIALFNSVLFVAFALTGISTFVLAFDLTGDRLASITAGILFAFAPFRFAHIPHLQLQLAFGIPLSLFFLRRLIKSSENHFCYALCLALTGIATFGSSLYYFIYLTTITPIVVLSELFHLSRKKRLQAVAWLTASFCIMGAAIAPLTIPYLEKANSGSVRSLAAASQFSASWSEYLSSFSIFHGFLPKANEPLFPGFVAVSLSLFALSKIMRNTTRVWTWVLIGMIGFWLSLGPSYGLFSFLYNHLPPYQALRVPSRAGVLVLLAVAILAAIGLSQLHRRWLRISLLFVAALECLAIPLPMNFSPPTYPDIYKDVEKLGTPGAMVELPLPPASRFQENAIYVYRSIYHRRQIVNGYSGFVPPKYRYIQRRLMQRNFIGSLSMLENEGVRFILAHEARLGPRMVRQIKQAQEQKMLKLISSKGEDRLYIVQASE